jgi:hypothetical protein
MPFPWPEPGRDSVAKVVPHPGGYSLEVLIPLSDLPPLAQDPLASFRVLVDFADSDSPSGTLKAFYSSASRRRFGDVSTFNVARLNRPRLFESRPPLVATVFSEETAAFFFPADAVGSLYTFNNLLRGPGVPFEYDSPTIEEMKLPEKPLRRVHGFDLYMVPVGIGVSNRPRSRLVAVRAERTVASYEFQGTAAEDEIQEVLERDLGSCRLLVFLGTGVLNPWGYGMCGGCPTGSFEVVTIDATGKMRFVDRDEDDIFCGFGTSGLVTLPADDSHFGFFCVSGEDEEAEEDTEEGQEKKADQEQAEEPETTEWKIPWSRYASACR